MEFGKCVTQKPMRGLLVYADRNGEFCLGRLLFPSKQPDKWVVKFLSDNKQYARSKEEWLPSSDHSEQAFVGLSEPHINCTAKGTSNNLESYMPKDGAMVKYFDGKQLGDWKFKGICGGKCKLQRKKETVKVPIDVVYIPLLESMDSIIGERLQVKRGNSLEWGVIQGVSKKKPDCFVVLFEDGKRLVKKLDDIVMESKEEVEEYWESISETCSLDESWKPDERSESDDSYNPLPNSAAIAARARCPPLFEKDSDSDGSWKPDDGSESDDSYKPKKPQKQQPDSDSDESWKPDDGSESDDSYKPKKPQKQQPDSDSDESWKPDDGSESDDSYKPKQKKQQQQQDSDSDESWKPDDGSESDDEIPDLIEPTEKTDWYVPSGCTQTLDESWNGTAVLALRKGHWSKGTVKGPSKKDPNKYAIRFVSDGRTLVIPKGDFHEDPTGSVSCEENDDAQSDISWRPETMELEIGSRVEGYQNGKYEWAEVVERVKTGDEVNWKIRFDGGETKLLDWSMIRPIDSEMEDDYSLEDRISMIEELMKTDREGGTRFCRSMGYTKAIWEEATASIEYYLNEFPDYSDQEIADLIADYFEEVVGPCKINPSKGKGKASYKGCDVSESEGSEVDF